MEKKMILNTSDNFKNVAASLMFMCNREESMQISKLKQDAKIEYSKQNLSGSEYITLHPDSKGSIFASSSKMP